MAVDVMPTHALYSSGRIHAPSCQKLCDSMQNFGRRMARVAYSIFNPRRVHVFLDVIVDDFEKSIAISSFFFHRSRKWHTFAQRFVIVKSQLASSCCCFCIFHFILLLLWHTAISTITTTTTAPTTQQCCSRLSKWQIQFLVVGTHDHLREALFSSILTHDFTCF